MGLDSKNAQKTEIKERKVLFGVPRKNFILLPLVNANNEQLKKMGFFPFKDDSGVETEPNYVRPKLDKDKNPMGHNMVQLEFYFKMIDAAAEGFPTLANEIYRMSFYIEEIDQPISGKYTYCFVNELGETQWATDADSLKVNAFCHSTKALRIAKKGEKDFLEVIHEIAGLQNGIIIERISDLFKGNYKEIIDLIKDINSQKGYAGFKALLAAGVSSKGNGYQDVFTRAFDYGAKEKPLRISKEIKRMNEEQGGQYAYKQYFGNKVSVGLVEFNEGMVAVDKPADKSFFEHNPDDLPF